MIYNAGTFLETKAKEKEWGTMYYFENPKLKDMELFALASDSPLQIRNGLNENLSIEVFENGFPNVVEKEDKDIYMIFPGLPGEINKQNCFKLKCLRKYEEETKIITIGRGNHNIFGIANSWQFTVVKVSAAHAVLKRIIWDKDECEVRYFVINDGKVYVADLSELPSLYQYLKLEIPFELKYYALGVGIDDEEWTENF